MSYLLFLNEIRTVKNLFRVCTRFELKSHRIIIQNAAILLFLVFINHGKYLVS